MRKEANGTRCPAIRSLRTTWTPISGLPASLATPRARLFRSIQEGDRFTDKVMTRFDVFHMIKRGVKAAALPYSTCCHTFRATGITTHLQNGGTLEHAQTIANHESPRTTKLYDRTREELSFDEVARIKF